MIIPNVGFNKKPCYVSIGGDPEFILTVKGKPIAACQVLEEDGIRDEEKRLGLFRDGYLAETRLKTSSCMTCVVENNYNHLSNIQRYLSSSTIAPKLSTITVVSVPRKEMEAASEDTRRLGCDMSLNYHNDGAKLGRVNPSRMLIRSAGGHIHIGGNGRDEFHRAFYSSSHASFSVPATWIHENAHDIVLTMDYLLGLMSVVAYPHPMERVRRKYYGRAGECRLPAYGVEYRVLSNFWVQDLGLFSLALYMARTAIHMVNDDKHKWLFEMCPPKTVAKIINSVDVRKAYPILEAVYTYVSNLYNAYGMGPSRDLSNPVSTPIGLCKTLGYLEWFKKRAFSDTKPDSVMDTWKHTMDTSNGYERTFNALTDRDSLLDLILKEAEQAVEEGKYSDSILV